MVFWSKMGLKEQHQQPDANSPTADDHAKPGAPRVSSCSTDKDPGLSLCRVCHCAEPDLRGQSALGFLGIVPPSRKPSAPRTDHDYSTKTSTSKDEPKGDAPRFVEFISPEGEIFVCAADVESAPLHQQDHLVDLGCSCKNELALAHYACALKWFISHGSTVCEICASVAANVRPDDFNKVLASLKDYEALRERTSTGELSYLQHVPATGVDPDAIAAIRRQRLSEISSWFNPHNSHVAVSQGQVDQPPLSPTNNSVLEHSAVAPRQVRYTRWSLESIGVLVAIGLAVIVLAWLVAPHVGKVCVWNTSVLNLHILCWLIYISSGGIWKLQLLNSTAHPFS